MSFLGFESLEPYDYRPIPNTSRTVRLLRILPPQRAILPGLSATTRIEIIQVDLDSEFCYDALSYCWDVPKGQTEPNRLVIVETQSGSRELRIFRPLELALSALQPGFNRPLFVDQICINQKDTKEREHQVGLMEIVYSKCTQTIVWLGNSTRASDLYFSYITKVTSEGILSRIIGPRAGQFMNVFDAVMDPSQSVTDSEKEDRDDILDLISRYGPEFPLNGIIDVLERKWFGRLWTIQEACLAPQVTFKCGNWELCYDCFRSGILFFHLCNNYWAANIKEKVPQWKYKQRNYIQDLGARIARIIGERNAIHKRGDRLPFYDVILRFNVNDDMEKIGATVPADRVFGLLGLVSKNDELCKQVKVNYQVGVARVYTDVASLLMKHSTDVLLFSQFPKKLDNLPSWVPDLSMTLKLPPSYTKLQSPLFSAGGATDQQTIEYDESKGQIKIRGVLIDTIRRVGQHTVSKRPERSITDQINYRSVSDFFDETDAFIKELSNSAGANSVHTDKEYDLLTLRLSDASLTFKQFEERWGLEEGARLLRACRTSVNKLSVSLIRSDEFIASRQIAHIAQSRSLPWYAKPMSEWEIIGMLARHPKKVAPIFISAAAHFLADIVSLCVASRGIPLLPWYLRLKKKLSYMEVRPNLEKNAWVLEKLKYDREILKPGLAGDFCANLLRNADRKLYLTERGYIGLGPSQMQAGDFVVVFMGGTVPHVLRPNGHLEGTGEGQWSYIGEAYCDGLMNGEIFSQDQREVTTFTLA